MPQFRDSMRVWVCRRAAQLSTVVFSMASVSIPALAQESAAAAPVPSVPDPSSAPRANALYLAGPNCPDESAFWTQVAAHRRNSETLESLRVRIEVFELESGAQARVTFVSASGDAATRELTASTCREATAAAALVVALALDAHVDERNVIDSPPARAPDRPPPAPSPSPGSPDAAKAPASKQSGLFWQFGGGAFAQQAIAPSPLFGASAFAGLGEHELPWEARVGVVFAGSGVTERNDASAEFSLLAAQLQGCAFAVVRSDRFLVDPCLAGEIGRVQSRGVENLRYLAEQDSSFWAAGGPLMRVSYVFSELWLEAYGGPWIPIAGTRDYVFADPQGNRSFHQVPPVGVVAGLRIALHLE